MSNFTYKVMAEEDIEKVIPLYMNYYNTYEEGEWTRDTVYKRIHQVLTREDAYCLLLMEQDNILGFAMGYMEQYADIAAYDLVEIVVAEEYQKKGIGTEFLQELEKRVKELGASMVQLQVVNDEMHERFCEKLNYGDATNFVLKCKWL